METQESRFLPGEKQLAEKLKKLVIPVYNQNGNKEDQADCLIELGNLSLQAGTDSEDGNKFTKASVLFNAAFCRTSNERKQCRIKAGLVQVKSEFIKIFFNNSTLEASELETRFLENKDKLKRIRYEIKEKSDFCVLEDIVRTYDHKSPTSRDKERLLIDKAKKVSEVVQREMIGFINLLWGQGLRYTNTTPPCNYSLVGLGSLARQEGTPFSDLEFAILVAEGNNESIQKYFKNLTYLFHLIVLDLGETPIPSLAIASLNDFLTPGGNWFYDKITTSGFTLDGSMPWACKTPIGRPATRTKEPLSLIQTPEAMAKLLKEDNELGKAYHVADVLSRTILISGDHGVYGKYKKEVIKVIDSNKNEWKKRRKKNAEGDFTKFYKRRSLYYIDAKQTFYRLPSLFIENLRSWLTPCYLDGSQWQVLENFVNKNIFEQDDICDLTLLIALTFAARLMTYYTNGGQHEIIYTGEPTTSSQDKLSPSVIQKTEMLSQKFVEMLATKLEREPGTNPSYGTTSSQWSKESFVCPPIWQFYFRNYFHLVQASEDQSASLINCCSESCKKKHVESMDDMELAYSCVENLVSYRCGCVALVKSYMKILIFMLKKRWYVEIDGYDITLERVLLLIKKSQHLRDKLFLTFGALKMAHFETRVKTVKCLVKHAETVMEDIAKLPEGNAHKGIYQALEYDFCYWLMGAYFFLSENDKILELSQNWIDALEKPHRKNADIEIDLEFVAVYIMLVKALFNIPEKRDDAFLLCKEILAKVESAVSQMYCYTEVLLHYVFDFAEILYKSDCFVQCEDLLSKYFFDGTREKYVWKSGDKIKVLCLLENCYMKNDKIEQALNVCIYVHDLSNNENFGKDLIDVERYILCNDYLQCCVWQGESFDVAECHSFLCLGQDNEILFVREMKVFLLIQALKLFTCLGQKVLGLAYLVRALPILIQENPLILNANQTNVEEFFLPVIDVLSHLYNTLWNYGIAKGLHTYSLLHLFICDEVSCILAFSHIPFPIPLRIFCEIDMLYRLCFHLLHWSMNHDIYLKQTIKVLQITRSLLLKHLPHYEKNVRLVERAKNECERQLNRVPGEVKQEPYMEEFLQLWKKRLFVMKVKLFM